MNSPEFFFKSLLLSLTAALLAVAGCQYSGAPGEHSTAADSASDSTPRIIAVSYPLQYLTQRLIGDRITVELASGDLSPLTWRPDRRAIASMQQADLIITNGTGASYAPWLVTVSLPDNKRINTATKGLSLSDYISVEDVRVVHSHGPEGEHSHATMVARTWLDPKMAIKQATYLATRLKERYPDAAESIDSHLKSLRAELEAIEIPDLAGQVVLSADHELKFLTRAADLSDVHLNLSAESDAAALAAALQQTQAGNAETKSANGILIPDYLASQLETSWKEIVAEQQLTPIVIDTLDIPDERDLLSRLQANFRALSAVPVHEQAD